MSSRGRNDVGRLGRGGKGRQIRINLRSERSRVSLVFSAYFSLIAIPVTNEKLEDGEEEGERRITTEVIRAARCKLAAGSLPGSAGTSHTGLFIYFCRCPRALPAKYVIFVRRSRNHRPLLRFYSTVDNRFPLPSPSRYRRILNKISFLSFPFLASRRQQRSKRRDSSPSDVSRVTQLFTRASNSRSNPMRTKSALEPSSRLLSIPSINYALSLSLSFSYRSLAKPSRLEGGSHSTILSSGRGRDRRERRRIKGDKRKK